MNRHVYEWLQERIGIYIYDAGKSEEWAINQALKDLKNEDITNF